MNTSMTPEEAKQKIIYTVLTTKDGWLKTFMESFDSFITYYYRHPDLPDVTVKMVRSFVAGHPTQYELSICIDERVLALEKDPNGPIGQIVIAAEKKRAADEIAERDNKLIAIAQSL